MIGKPSGGSRRAVIGKPGGRGGSRRGPGSFVDAPFPANSEHCLQQCRVSVTPGSTDSAAPPPRVRQAGCEVDWWILGWKSCQNRLRNWPEVHDWSEGRVGGSTPNRLEILLKATQKSSQKLSSAGSRGVPAGTRGGPGGVLGHLGRPGRVLGGCLGPSWGRPGPSWGRLGPPWEASWVVLEGPWGRLGGLSRRLRASWGGRWT